MGESTSGRSRRCWVRAWLALALALAAPDATDARQAEAVPTLHSDSPSFRIPFNIQDPSSLRQIAEVHLYVSNDRGLSWQYTGATAPDQLAFPYRAPRDGEYWFAVRTRDRQDRLYPPDLEQVRPKLKVVVDTQAPAVRVQALARRGDRVEIFYEVQDEHLDLEKTLVVEYHIQGAPANEWRQVQVAPKMRGQVSWQAGTGLPLTVRVSVADRAGNRGVAVEEIADGIAAAPRESNGPAAGAAPPPIAPADRDDERPASAFEGLDNDPFAGVTGRSAPSSTGSSAASPPAPPREATPRPTAPRAPPAEQGPRPSAGSGPLIVGGARLPLSYDVQDGPAETLAAVEMWVTTDGGASWTSLGTDPDRTSPFQVDLGGDGRYGLRLVVQAQNGLGDARPTPGTPPDFEVVVDTAPPALTLESVQLGVGDQAGMLLVAWRTEEAHPSEDPIVLSIRPDSPDAIWQQITAPMPDLGRFEWPLPTNLPARFHVRIDARDALGNASHVETREPITLDLPRPKGRILGIDPSASVPSAHAIR